MPTITASGTGSGLDIESIISKLTEAERPPVQKRLDLRETEIQSEITAFGSLKGALSDFKSSLFNLKSLQTIAARAATSSNPDSFTASATNSASVGSSQIEVVNLASAHKLISQNSFTGPDDAIGAGTITVGDGTSSFSVDIVGGQNNTLAGIRDAINNASDNPGVTASILTISDGLGGTVSKLVLSSDNTGADHFITVSVTGDSDGNDTDNSGLSSFVFNADKTGNMDEKNLAQNALIRVDGYDVSSDTNVFTNAIQGVTLTAVKADPGVNQTLNVSIDKSAIKDNLAKFVTNINALKQTLEFLTKYDPETKQAGLLTGDFAARTIDSQVRRILTGAIGDINNGYNSLASIGITTQRDGTMAIDSAKLDDALNNNFDQVANLLAGDNGIAKSLDSTLDSFLKTGGLISTRNQTFLSQLTDIDEQRTKLDDHIKSYETRLRAQYTAMDAIVSQLNNTGTFLQTQLASITKSTTSK